MGTEFTAAYEEFSKLEIEKLRKIGKGHEKQ